MGTAVVAIIPARGGSKRIPQKNIKALRGKPMIAYTIGAATDSGLFQRVIVSTDSMEIAEIAREYGADVPFLREPNLADDVTPVSAVTVDALRRLGNSGVQFEFVAQLMPNCPLRTAQDICDSHRQFEQTGADAQISVVRYGWQNPWWAMKRSAKLRLEPVFKEQIATRSQDLPELFCPTGAIWWARTETLSRAGTFYGENATGWEIPWQRGLDIDTPEDWAMAEVLTALSKRENDLPQGGPEL